MQCVGLVAGHRFSDATSESRITAANSGAAGLGNLPGIGSMLFFFILLFASVILSQVAHAQEQSPAQQATEPNSEQKSEPKKEERRSAREQKSFGGELAQETREATGAEEEEHADLKHAGPIRWLARKSGLNVHQAHMLALTLNFAFVVIVVVWAGRKFLPAMFRNRTASIQQSLEEARAASQDANRRLSDIENRLRQLDVEIGQMQANAEKEAAAEEARIQRAAEEDVRKVVVAAEQEIAAAAKQARRELTAYTAGLAIALARQQINVDSNTDQVLVRSFATTLASGNKNGGKEGK